MRVLFDNGTPRGVVAALSGHIVEEARSRGWDTLRNGRDGSGDLAKLGRDEPPPTSPEHYDRDPSASQILLVADTAIGRDEYIESGRFRRVQQVAAMPGSFTEVEIPVD